MYNASQHQYQNTLWDICFFVSINFKLPVLVNYKWYQHYFCIFVIVRFLFNFVQSLKVIRAFLRDLTFGDLSRSHAAFSTLLTSKIVLRTSQGWKKVMLTWVLGATVCSQGFLRTTTCDQGLWGPRFVN